MRTSVMMLFGLVITFSLSLPGRAAAQCGTCEQLSGTKWKCEDPMNNPWEPPYCFGTQILGMGCHTCQIDEEEEDQLALATEQLSPDGSRIEREDLRSILEQHPDWGHYLDPGRAVAYSCDGAIIARHYLLGVQKEVRRRTAVISI